MSSYSTSFYDDPFHIKTGNYTPVEKSYLEGNAGELDGDPDGIGKKSIVGKEIDDDDDDDDAQNHISGQSELKQSSSNAATPPSNLKVASVAAGPQSSRNANLKYLRPEAGGDIVEEIISERKRSFKSNANRYQNSGFDENNPDDQQQGLGLPPSAQEEEISRPSFFLSGFLDRIPPVRSFRLFMKRFYSKCFDVWSFLWARFPKLMTLFCISFYIFFGTLLLGSLATLCFLLSGEDALLNSLNLQDWISIFVSFVPLIGLEITLGFNPASFDAYCRIFSRKPYDDHIRERQELLKAAKLSRNSHGQDDEQQQHRVVMLEDYRPFTEIAPVALLVSVCWILGCLMYGNFNPLIAIFVTATSFCSLGVLQRVGPHVEGLTYSDIAVWLWLWVPLDLRWIYTGYWKGQPGMSYNWWAVANAVLLIG